MRFQHIIFALRIVHSHIDQMERISPFFFREWEGGNCKEGMGRGGSGVKELPLYYSKMFPNLPYTNPTQTLYCTPIGFPQFLEYTLSSLSVFTLFSLTMPVLSALLTEACSSCKVHVMSHSPLMRLFEPQFSQSQRKEFHLLLKTSTKFILC